MTTSLLVTWPAAAVLQVKASEMSIQRLLKAVTALDIASARAKYADWCSGVKPSFLTRQQADQASTVTLQELCIQLNCLW